MLQQKQHLIISDKRIINNLMLDLWQVSYKEIYDGLSYVAFLENSCKLCLSEKLEILKIKDRKHLINHRRKITTNYRHEIHSTL